MCVQNQALIGHGGSTQFPRTQRLDPNSLAALELANENTQSGRPGQIDLDEPDTIEDVLESEP